MNRREDVWPVAVAELVDRWRRTVEGTAAARHGASAAGIAFTSSPQVCDVRIAGQDGPVVLLVRLLPGQVTADLAAVASRIASGMGVAGARVRPGRAGFAEVALLLRDPLAGVLPLNHHRSGVLLGRTEDGEDLRVSPVDMPHVIAQGSTRSGKSAWLYALIAQVVREPHLEIAGVDPSGITLRPLTATGHSARIVLGLGDLAAVEAVLDGLVADMDARLGAMPLDRDVLPTGPVWPLRIVVLEEWPAVLRGFDTTTSATGKRVRALVARLLAESHKVGFRVIIAAQRAEASIVGGAERAQCAGRLTFRVDGLDSIKLLHTDADAYVTDHIAAPPGVALCTWPGMPLSRIRAPWIGGYGQYAASIASVGGAAA